MKPLALHLPDEFVFAPDGSEIRVLAGSVAHCTLPVGAVSQAVAHKTVEEIWYFLEGEGEVYRQQGDDEPVITRVTANSALTIPLGTRFQFRNTGNVPLRFVITTMPPWPGQDEAFPVDNYWTPIS